MIPGQMDVNDNIVVLENEWIYLDWVTLAIIDGYSIVRQRINRLQRLTNSVTYRMISGALCSIFYFFWLLP